VDAQTAGLLERLAAVSGDGDDLASLRPTDSTTHPNSSARVLHVTPDAFAWSWRQYLGDRYDDPPSEAVPLYADSVLGVPPALLLAAGRDPSASASLLRCDVR
jgi:acetyl esterase/lipase